MGADEAVGNEPIDRYAESVSARKAVSASSVRMPLRQAAEQAEAGRSLQFSERAPLGLELALDLDQQLPVRVEAVLDREPEHLDGPVEPPAPVVGVAEQVLAGDLRALHRDVHLERERRLAVRLQRVKLLRHGVHVAGLGVPPELLAEPAVDLVRCHVGRERVDERPPLGGRDLGVGRRRAPLRVHGANR